MSDIKGKIVLKTPFICECCIRSDRVYKTLNSFKKTHWLNYQQASI